MFAKKLDMSFNKLENLLGEADKRDELTDDVYHYTTKDSLEEILKSRKFFMCNLKDKKIFNTLNEFRYALESLKKLISKRELLIPIKVEGTETTKFWESLELYLHKIECFQLSFCLNRNDSYMWETFCKNKKDPVSIKISKDYFKLSKLKEKLHENTVRTKIYYENSESDEGYLNELFSMIYEILSIIDKIVSQKIMQDHIIPIAIINTVV